MYDYVIVGAGPAGCVLANRLTEDPARSVLLLESGGADTAREVHIPAAFSRLYQSPYDWSYSTEEQEQLKQRKVYIPRGKVLGGSSSILLGKAYLQVAPWLALFASYFVLGHPKTLDGEASEKLL